MGPHGSRPGGRSGSKVESIAIPLLQMYPFGVWRNDEVPHMESGKKTNRIDSQSAIITNIQGFSIHDGPGIRTVVFFKGCPLSCQWCANPECLSEKPQMGFIENLCKDCGKCLEVCTNNAIRRTEGEHHIDYARCGSCGNCRDQCSYGALIRYGESMAVTEVWNAVGRGFQSGCLTRARSG